MVLAAATVVVAAAAAIIVVAAAVAAPGAAAVAEQQDQDDDPANITAAETVVVTHIHYLRKNLQRHLPLIPRYSGAGIWCEKYRRGFPLRYAVFDYAGEPSINSPSKMLRTLPSDLRMVI